MKTAMGTEASTAASKEPHDGLPFRSGRGDVEGAHGPGDDESLLAPSPHRHRPGAPLARSLAPLDAAVRRDEDGAASAAIVPEGLYQRVVLAPQLLLGVHDGGRGERRHAHSQLLFQHTPGPHGGLLAAGVGALP